MFGKPSSPDTAVIAEHETRVKPVSVEEREEVTSTPVSQRVPSPECSVERMAGRKIKGTMRSPERNLVAKSVVQSASI